MPGTAFLFWATTTSQLPRRFFRNHHHHAVARLADRPITMAISPEIRQLQ